MVRTVKRNIILGVVVIAGLYLGLSYISRAHSSEVLSVIQSVPTWLGMFIFACAAILAEIVAPITVLPALPVLASVWGSFTVAGIAVMSWTLGSVIAFWIARQYGTRVVLKFTEEENLEYVRSYFPAQEEGQFWLIVVLRVLIPIDVTSYAMGLFMRVSLKTFALATFIGWLPSAFIFSYLGQIPLFYQLFAFIGGACIIYLLLQRLRRGRWYRR